jgi:hypothetical protein
MSSFLSRLRALSGSDWGVLLGCAWVIPAVELNVRWRAPRRWLPPESASTSLPASPLSTAAADRVTHLVDAVYRRLPVEPTCLTRSLVLYRLLRARSIPCRLRIGLRRNPSALEGHAWTETDRHASEAANYEVVLSF